MSALPETRVVRLARKGSCLFVTMDDPVTRNALSQAMVSDLEAVLAATRDDRTLQAMVLQGCEGRFCAGADLKGTAGLEQGPGGPDPVREENRRGGRLFHAMNGHPLAVIALVDGPAMGGGFGLACCADIVVTTPNARFALSETRLGLAPAQIAPFVVGRIGLSATRRLALTGARLGGEEACAIGLGDHHCASLEAADALVQRLLADIGRCGPRANAMTKALLLDIAGADRAERLIERAAEVFTACLRGDEGREGVAAFIEKRPPAWTGTT